MKTYILDSNLLYYVSRREEADAYKIMFGSKYKSSHLEYKASKNMISFEGKTDKINFYKKPRFMNLNYFEHKSCVYVGLLLCDDTIVEDDVKYIEDYCKKINIIPIISSVGTNNNPKSPFNIHIPRFGDMIRNILNCNTFRYVYKDLDHKSMFQEYVEFNKIFCSKIQSLVKKGDSIFITDYNLMLVPGLMDIRTSFSFNIRINELFRCIPYYENLLNSLLKCNFIDFFCKISREAFNLLIEQHIFDQDISKPNFLYLERGINKSYIDKIISSKGFMKYSRKEDESFSKDKESSKSKFNQQILTDISENNNVIIIPYNSHTHILGIDAYVNKYTCPVTVILLNIGNINIEKQIEVHRTVEYLKLSKNITIISYTPKNDCEFIALIKKSTICFHNEINDICLYFNKHVIKANIYDYDLIADIIYDKLNSSPKESIVKDNQDYCNFIIFKLDSQTQIEKTKVRCNTNSSVVKFYDVTKNNYKNTPFYLDVMDLQNKGSPCSCSEHSQSNDEKSSEMIENTFKSIGSDISKMHLKDSSEDINYNRSKYKSSTENISGSTSSENNTSSQSFRKNYSKDESREIQCTKYTKQYNFDYVNDICTSIKNSDDITFLFDYDGTLVPIVKEPKNAKPSKKLIELLNFLSEHANVIICTGRSSKDMDKWIPKDIEVYAEHGAFHRYKGKWSRMLKASNFDLPYNVAKFYQERTPNSYLEKKESGFTFHYRKCNPIIADKQAKSLYSMLKRMSINNVKLGKSVVEYKSSSKDMVLNYIDTDLLIIAGDDKTDEDMFDNSKGITIKVGRHKTRAKYYVNDVDEFLKLLSIFSKALQK